MWEVNGMVKKNKLVLYHIPQIRGKKIAIGGHELHDFSFYSSAFYYFPSVQTYT